MTVFKAYDIRGLYKEQIDEDLARRIGQAFAQLIGGEEIVVGRDMRTMAPSISAAFIEGAMSAGTNVLDIGLASTPMTYYAIGSSGCDGGVQVTASHNPPQYIGFKFCRKGCVPMSRDTGIAELETMTQAPEPSPAQTRGTLRKLDVMPGYIDHVMSFAGEIKGLKVVIDTANGMGGHALPQLLERLPISATVLFPELDGNFPNHEADPLKVSNLKWCAAEVKKQGADLGLAFDGDADRCVFIDERGEPVRSDLITGVFIDRFFQGEENPKAVYDLRSTRAVAEAIEAKGGEAVRERVGHSFIKATMRKVGAVFGGELSGHFYFRDNYVCDSGEIAMVSMLSLLSEAGKPLSELVEPFRKYPSTGELNFRVDDAAAKLAEVKERFKDGDQDELDGVTVRYSDWWFNLRMSNTEPLIRLNLEADNQALLDEKRELLQSFLGTVAEGH